MYLCTMAIKMHEIVSHAKFKIEFTKLRHGIGAISNDYEFVQDNVQYECMCVYVCVRQVILRSL